MKKLQLIIVLALVPILFYCFKSNPNTKPTNIDEINNSDIKAKYSLMTTNVIVAKNEKGVLLETGAVMIYITNSNTFGKLEVVSINAIDNELTLNVILLNADGTIKSKTNNVIIHSGLGCDLDVPAEDNLGLRSDIKWNIYGDNNVKASIDLINGALFLKYT
jgi:hypothetical protein